jgi:predicted nuclease of predicted toxin-antitoxin system
MRILIDMNLSPDWVHTLDAAGINAVHWSTVGNRRAKDQEILEWARANDWVVFTHDLGFCALLANSNAGKPSVLQVRTQDVTPSALAPKVIAAFRQFASLLAEGAIISIDEHGSRARILPLK